jgi:FkbM family methyltransferase
VRHLQRHASRERIRKLRKAVRLAKVKRFRRALSHGVAAAIEHDEIPLPTDIRTVIDVGSHRGQFAVLALSRFPNARVLCFEPLEEPRSTLREVVAADRDRVEVFPYAAAASGGSQTMEVSRADASSSLRPIGPRHVTAFPGTDPEAATSVQAARIDEVVEAVDLPCLMKIDVQGCELEVLQGAEKLLPKVEHLVVECSFTELYLGQALAGEVVAYLDERGYDLTGIYGLKRDRLGFCLQADFRFQRH